LEIEYDDDDDYGGPNEAKGLDKRQTSAAAPAEPRIGTILSPSMPPKDGLSKEDEENQQQQQQHHSASTDHLAGLYSDLSAADHMSLVCPRRHLFFLSFGSSRENEMTVLGLVGGTGGSPGAQRALCRGPSHRDGRC